MSWRRSFSFRSEGQRPSVAEVLAALLRRGRWAISESNRRNCHGFWRNACDGRRAGHAKCALAHALWSVRRRRPGLRHAGRMVPCARRSVPLIRRTVPYARRTVPLQGGRFPLQGGALALQGGASACAGGTSASTGGRSRSTGGTSREPNGSLRETHGAPIAHRSILRIHLGRASPAARQGRLSARWCAFATPCAHQRRVSGRAQALCLDLRNVPSPRMPSPFPNPPPPDVSSFPSICGKNGLARLR